MNNKELKIVKFAITQDNIELLIFALSKNKLNEEQLSECLLLAKDKPNCYQELANQISDDTKQTDENQQSETKTEFKKESEKEKEKEKETEKKIKGKLLYLSISNNCVSGLKQEIPEDFWTKENLEYENGSKGTILHYLAGKTPPNSEALEYLKRVISLYPEGCLKKAKNDTGETPLENTICKISFEAFQIVWDVVKTNEIETKYLKTGILSYITNSVGNLNCNKYLHHLIIGRKLKLHEKDLEQLGAILYKVLYRHPHDTYTQHIVHELLKLDGASEQLLDYRLKLRNIGATDIKMKSFNYIFSLEDEKESIVEILLKSNGFFLYLNEEKDLIIKSPLLLERYLKYCPKNIINESKEETKNIEHGYNLCHSLGYIVESK